MVILTHAEGFPVLGPIPVAGLVAPTTPLTGEHVPGVAVELDHGARGEGEGALPAMWRCRQRPT